MESGAHWALAAGETESSRQAEEWRRARSSYARGAETLRPLLREGLLLAQVTAVLGQIEAAIARCEGALEGLESLSRPQAAAAAR